MKQFATVHCHPNSLDSASTPEAFAKREVELGSPAVVCTDHGSLASAYEIYELAQQNKLTPVIGLEAYFRDDNCPILLDMGVKRTHTVPKGTAQEEWRTRYPQGTFIDYAKYYHVTLGFMDYEAYLTAVKMLSRADARAEQHGSERKPLFDWEALEELAAKNVTATSSCLIGMVQRHLLAQGNPTGARAYFNRMKHLFGDRFYTEVFPHTCTHEYVNKVFLDFEGHESMRFYTDKKLRTDAADEITATELAGAWNREKNPHTKLVAIKNYHSWDPLPEPLPLTAVRWVEGFIENECKPWAPDGDVQLGCNHFVRRLSQKYNVPIVIGDDSHFAHPEEKIVQDLRLAQAGDWRFHGSYHRQSSAEAFEYFNKKMGILQPEFEQWVDNSHAWVERFKGFKFDTAVSIPTKFFPKDTLGYTRELIQLHGRMRKDRRYVERLGTELNLLHRNGKLDLLSYFFLDEEVCRLHADLGILTGPGRGSAAGLLLSNLLGITHVDPIARGLSLERFLTQDRILSGKMPDIDQDLPGQGLLAGPTSTDPAIFDIVEFIAEDDTRHRAPALFKVKTPDGWVPIGDVAVSGQLFEAWWRPDDRLALGGGIRVKTVIGRAIQVYEGWLKERFGNHVMRVSIDTKLKLRSAVKDCARLRYGHVPEEIERLVSKFAKTPQGLSDYKFAFGYFDKGTQTDVPGSIEPGHSKSDPALREYAAKYPEDMAIVKKALGLARQKGQHPCAFIIANRPIEDFIPTTTVSGNKVTAFTAGPVEAVGGLKMDFLSLNSLRDIQGAIELIQERICGHRLGDMTINGILVHGHEVVPTPEGEYFSIWDLIEDQRVFNDVATGKTETVFQFNTPGAVQWLQHFAYRKADGNMAIDSVDSMAAFTALDRPGPLDVPLQHPELPDKTHNAMVEYARRARGAPGSQSILPVLDELLPETYGVMVYQEQLQRVYQNLTGCTGSEAEKFRTNVAKKLFEKVNDARGPFIERAGAKVGVENAEKLWDFLKTWAQYGFNKSHAVCYADLAYGSAYLKHHYPLEWWCSVLRNAEKDEVNEKFWRHCGHLVALPDVRLSGLNWNIEGDKIRAPVSLLHGVGEKAHEQLCKYAPYDSIDDLVEKVLVHRENTRTKKEVKKPGTDETETVWALGRSAISRRTIYTLIVAGALDSLFPPDTSIGERLDAYDKAMALAAGSRVPKATTKRDKEAWKRCAKGGKKTPYPTLDPIGRYQMRKSVLPAWGGDLRALVKALPMPEFLRMPDPKRMRYLWRRWSRPQSCMVDVEDAVVGVDRLDAMNRSETLPGNGYRCAVLAYVEQVGRNGKRTFRYGPMKEKEGCPLTLDVGGGKFEFVHWPDRDGTVPAEVKTLEEGSVIAALLVRNRADRPFSVRELRLVRGALKGTKEEEKTDGEED